jgi:hypothetical protein
VLSVVRDGLVDNEAPMVTSSISSRGFASPVFEGAHKGRVYVRSFIEMNVREL